MNCYPHGLVCSFFVLTIHIIADKFFLKIAEITQVILARKLIKNPKKPCVVLLLAIFCYKNY